MADGRAHPRGGAGAGRRDLGARGRRQGFARPLAAPDARRLKLAGALAGAAALAGLAWAAAGHYGDEAARITVVPGPAPAPAARPASAPGTRPPAESATVAVETRAVATLAEPWALTLLPDDRLLVTEKRGSLRIVTPQGLVSAPVAGVPAVRPGGQGGLLDVALDPSFAANRHVWLSFSEPTGNLARLALARATLVEDGGTPRLDGLTVLWRQTPAASGGKHYGGRIAFARDGLLYLTAGERDTGAPAQDLSTTLGKVIRLNRDGSIPADNPFNGRAGALPEIWSYGHRNPYGLVADADGALYESEMGPEGGDELNLIRPRRNYGWPLVSEGNQYGGAPIPRHATDPSKTPPLVSWTPVIAPGGMIRYAGTRFRGWTGDFVLAGLASQALVRVRVAGTRSREVGRIAMGARVRDVEEARDGALWVLTDGPAGRLLRVLPARN